MNRRWPLQLLPGQSIGFMHCISSIHTVLLQNYDSTCETTNSCQNQIATVDSISKVTIYGLSTVASTYQLSVNNHGVINQSSNSNGFESTVTVWSKN